MSDFVLEISGAGEAITLEPIGCVDRQGALTLIEAVESVQSGEAHAAPGDPHGPHHGLHRRTRRAAGPQRPARPGPGRLSRHRRVGRPTGVQPVSLSRQRRGDEGQVVVARDRLVGLPRRGAVARGAPAPPSRRR